MMGAFLRSRIGSPESVLVSMSIKAAVHFAFLFARVEESGEGEGSDDDGCDLVPL